MAHAKAAKTLPEIAKLSQVLDTGRKFVAHLRDRLGFERTQCQELEAVLNRAFGFSSPGLSEDVAADCDILGCQLWNAALQVHDTNPGVAIDVSASCHPSDEARAISLLLSMAFILVAIASPLPSTHQIDSCSRHVRTLKIALKASRYLIGHGECQLADRVLIRCVDYTAAIEKLMFQEDGNLTFDSMQHHKCYQFVYEFHLMQLTKAWKMNHEQLMERSFHAIDRARRFTKTGTVRLAADLLHQIAASRFQGQHEEALLTWAERSLATLNELSVEHLDPETNELRLAISTTLIEALLRSPNISNRSRAEEVVNDLQSYPELSIRISVAVLRFNIGITSVSTNSRHLLDIVLFMIRTAVLTDLTFDIILQTISKLKNVVHLHAIEALQSLITSRLVVRHEHDREYPNAGMNSERFEKATVMLICVATSSQPKDHISVQADLQAFLDRVLSASSSTALSAAATQAAQLSLWKAACSPQTSVEARTAWCQILQNSIFTNAGQVNKSRIARKLVSLAIERNDVIMARKLLFAMNPSDRRSAISRYLAFKIAIISNDTEFAVETLQAISSDPDADKATLFACVVESQRANRRNIAILSLQALLDLQPVGLRLPPLLRCLIKLLMGEMHEHIGRAGAIMEHIISIFQYAVSNIDRLKHKEDDHNHEELEWWYKNAYNLALEQTSTADPHDLVALLECCSSFLNHIVNTSKPLHKLVEKQATCHFLCAVTHVIIGRSQDNAPTTDAPYSEARRHISMFKSVVDVYDKDERPGLRPGIRAQLFELSKLEIECIMNLETWSDLDQALQDLLDYNGSERWDTVIDLVVILHDHVELSGRHTAFNLVPDLLQKCINETWKKDKDIVKMARWLRLTFSMHTSDSDPSQIGFALKIVQQASTIAQRRQSGESYPEAELQWLAITTFNRAVDFLVNDENLYVDEWMAAALELARYADDNGALHANLTAKRKMADERRILRLV